MNSHKTLDGWLEEIKKEMIQKFQDHHDKWKEVSVMLPTFDFNTQLADEEYLREEVHYHYAKWLYRGRYKKDIPEKDTLINLINMCALLWIKLDLKVTPNELRPLKGKNFEINVQIPINTDLRKLIFKDGSVYGVDEKHKVLFLLLKDGAYLYPNAERSNYHDVESFVRYNSQYQYLNDEVD